MNRREGRQPQSVVGGRSLRKSAAACAFAAAVKIAFLSDLKTLIQ